MTMNTLVNIPQEIYSNVAEHILESADDEHDGTMTFELNDEEFEDKEGNVYNFSASGLLFYEKSYEEWGWERWINHVSFYFAECKFYDEYGEDVPTDFDRFKIQNYIN